MKRNDICTIIIAILALFSVAVTIHMAARGIVYSNLGFGGTIYKTCCMALAGFIDIAAIVVLAIYNFVESRVEDRED